MFLRIFKREFSLLIKIILILSAISAGVALLLGFGARLTSEHLSRVASTGRVPTFFSFAMFASYLGPVGIAAIFIVQIVVAVLRFYRATMSDEAYLTFTLPATGSEQYRARFLALFLYVLIAAATGAIGYIVYFSIAIGPAEVFTSLAEGFVNMAKSNAVGLILLILILLIQPLKYSSEFIFNILFASKIARRGRFGVAVGLTAAMFYAEIIVISLLLGTWTDMIYFGGWSPDTVVPLAAIFLLNAGETALFMILSERMMRAVNVN